MILGFRAPDFPDAGTITWQLASRAPIERGGRFGFVGNGHQQLKIRTMLRTADGLSMLSAGVDSDYAEVVSKALFDYFSCPGCSAPI
jgi:hypothetical protein